FCVPHHDEHESDEMDIAYIMSTGKQITFSPSHCVLAHELGHLLGHLEEFMSTTQHNLMSGYRVLSDDHLTPEQCAAIKTSPHLIPVNPDDRQHEVPQLVEQGAPAKFPKPS